MKQGIFISITTINCTTNIISTCIATYFTTHFYSTISNNDQSPINTNKTTVTDKNISIDKSKQTNTENGLNDKTFRQIAKDQNYLSDI